MSKRSSPGRGRYPSGTTNLTCASGSMNRAISHALAIVHGPSSAKQRFDLGVREAIHEVGLADRSLPAAGHDFSHLPLKIFDRLVRAGKHVDRVFDGDGAETLQPAPYLDPEIVGLGRDLMDQQDPAVRGRLRHAYVASQANHLTITSVSGQNFPSKLAVTLPSLEAACDRQRCGSSSGSP